MVQPRSDQGADSHQALFQTAGSIFRWRRNPWMQAFAGCGGRRSRTRPALPRRSRLSFL